VIYLTTQADEGPAGVFKTKLNYFRAIRDGLIADRKSLPLLYEFPEELLEAEAYLQPENFYITNPNLGRSVDLEWLTDELVKVLNAVGGEKQVFLAKHLNVEIGMRLSQDAWVGARYWEKATDPDLSLDELLARSEVAVVGIDGGGLDDLLGLAVIGRCRETLDWLLWTRAWVHSDVLDLRKEIAPRLLEFHQQGDLVICETPTQDIEQVADLVAKVRDAGLLPDAQAVGFDPQGVSAMIDELASRKITDDQIVAIPQGFRLSGAVWGVERKLKNHPLAWRSAAHDLVCRQRQDRAARERRADHQTGRRQSEDRSALRRLQCGAADRPQSGGRRARAGERL
jgi:phage terminase large subunit-like protein